jgi:hypothetical protein
LVLKVRESGRVANVHALLATGVNADGFPGGPGTAGPRRALAAYWCVRTERGAGVASGPLLRAARRTRRATFTAPGRQPRPRRPARPGERADAELKNWRLLCKVRSSLAHATLLIDAVQTLIINAEAV